MVPTISPNKSIESSRTDMRNRSPDDPPIGMIMMRLVRGVVWFDDSCENFLQLHNFARRVGRTTQSEEVDELPHITMSADSEQLEYQASPCE